jgi:DNA-binding NtrC family response regulator
MPFITLKTPDAPPVVYRFDGDTITVGRAEGNDLVLRSPSVSRFHLEIRRADRGFVAADLGSSNGTWLNDRPLVGQEPLAPGDELRVGGMRLFFEAAAVGVPVTPPARTVHDDGLVGTSAAMVIIREGLARVAASMATVLVTGESGTGKELVAQALHRRSPRSRGPFVVVNCPTLRGSLLESELFGVERGVATGVAARTGRLEKAHGGTLFLDEVGDLDAVAQAMLLRFLQDHAIERLGGRERIALDVRVIAATNRDLEEDVRRGTFRQDLLHRLDVVSLRLPPLRRRREDVPALIDHFLSRDGAPIRLSAEARKALLTHDYPGNVRQLEHALESAALLAGGAVIRLEHLPASFRRDDAPLAEADPAGALLEALVQGGSFWELVREPYLRRELSKDAVRELVRRARERAGRHATMRDVARLLGIEAQHKKLLNFLWTHGLRERDAEVPA